MEDTTKFAIHSFIGNLGDGLLGPFIIVYLMGITGDIFSSGIIMASYRLLASLGAPIGGILSDTIGRKIPGLTTELASAYVVYRMAFIKTTEQVYGIVLAFAACTTIGGSALYALKQEITEGEKQGTAISILNLVGGVGSGVAVVAGAYIVQNHGFPLLFQSAAVLIVLGALPIIFIRGKN